MAQSPNGRYLYPIVEKALTNDTDKRRRIISEFDTRTGRYTGRHWAYRVDTDANLVADAQMISKHRLLVLERDDFDGDAAVTKRVYTVDLRPHRPVRAAGEVPDRRPAQASPTPTRSVPVTAGAPATRSSSASSRSRPSSRCPTDAC